MRAEEAMAEHALTIPYSDDLLLPLEESPEQFEAEARLLLAVKLYEPGRSRTPSPRFSRERAGSSAGPTSSRTGQDDNASGLRDREAFSP